LNRPESFIQDSAKPNHAPQVRFILLVEVVQSLLEPIGIVFCLLRRVSPLLFEIRSSRRQGFALNESSNVISNIIRLIFPRVATNGFARASVDQKFLKVGLDFTKSGGGAATSFDPPPEWQSSRSKQVHFVCENCSWIRSITIFCLHFESNQRGCIRFIVPLIGRRNNYCKFSILSKSIDQSKLFPYSHCTQYYGDPNNRGNYVVQNNVKNSLCCKSNQFRNVLPGNGIILLDIYNQNGLYF